MALEPRFTRKDVQRRFDAFLDQIQKQQIKRLSMLGEMCVNHARSVPKDLGFEDQTGNLRSSIGYAVFVDGVAVHSFYEEVKGGTEGANAGQRLSEKIGEGSSGVCLVVTAGMHYATYVESRGRDVIASAEQLAKRELPRMLEKLIQNIKQAVE